MIILTRSLDAWGTPEFEKVFKRELEQVDAANLPLQQGLKTGSHALHGTHMVMVIRAAEAADDIHVKAGIFYVGILTGCACADDPTPVNEESEYCVVQMRIDKRTAETTVTLLPE